MNWTILIELFPLFAFTWKRRLRFKCSPTVILSEYDPEMSDSSGGGIYVLGPLQVDVRLRKFRWRVSSWNHR
jgi:hypothetical protein